MMHRSASAMDVYNMSQHEQQSNMSDDGTGLNEMYSKHTLNLPMHSPAFSGVPQNGQSPQYTEHAGVDMDMNQLVQFDSVDGNSMSPENSAMH